jgi:hypothetical protein
MASRFRYSMEVGLVKLSSTDSVGISTANPAA